MKVYVPITVRLLLLISCLITLVYGLLLCISPFVTREEKQTVFENASIDLCDAILPWKQHKSSMFGLAIELIVYSLLIILYVYSTTQLCPYAAIPVRNC